MLKLVPCRANLENIKNHRVAKKIRKCHDRLVKMENKKRTVLQGFVIEQFQEDIKEIKSLKDEFLTTKPDDTVEEMEVEIVSEDDFFES